MIPIMLSISLPMKGVGHAEYYLNLASEDYYTSSGEEPGCWFGRGAQALSLGKEVRPDVYKNLLLGKTPDGSLRLVQNADDPDRQTGWDLTFSAPKSVSVAWAFAPEPLRTAIEDSHRNAVKEALAYLEDTAALTRRGKGGKQIERVALFFATFLHHTSRELDPQLHTHSILINLGVRKDGTTGALRTKDIFESKMSAGAIYRIALAHGLREHARLKLRATPSGFEIDGISDEVCSKFSKRRRKILDALAKRGVGDAISAKQAALSTRPAKVQLETNDLQHIWTQSADSLGWTENERRRAFTQVAPQKLSTKEELRRAFDIARAKLSKEDNSPKTLTALAASLAIEMHADAQVARGLYESLKASRAGEKSPVTSATVDQAEPSPIEAKGREASVNAENSNAIIRPSGRGCTKLPARPKDPSSPRSKPNAEQDGLAHDSTASPVPERKARDEAAPQPTTSTVAGGTSPGDQVGSDTNRDGTRRREPNSSIKNERDKSTRSSSSGTPGNARIVWTNAEVGKLDARLAVTSKQQTALFTICRNHIRSGAIHGPVLGQALPRTRKQKASNRQFAQALAAKLETIFPEKQTLDRVTWHAVALASKHKADPWALLYTLRNISPAAGRGYLHVEWSSVFPRAPLRAIRNIRMPRAVIGERARRWGNIVWRRDLMFAELRIQKRRLFPKAPRWSPLHSLEFRAIRVVPVTPKWLRGEDKITRLKPKKNLTSCTRQSEKKQEPSHSQSY